jgi:anaerobic ribonucleoside-triphosphate reductase activating protein
MALPRLSLSKLHFPITALGPGRRIGIWVQGCSIRCAGCMSRDTWAFSEGDEPVDALLNRMAPWLTEADGVTISGGEPFDQPHGLLTLLSALSERFDGDVLVYSGYRFEVLEARHGDALALIDALISEPF